MGLARLPGRLFAAEFLQLPPELTHYLASVSSSRRLAINGSYGGHWRVFRTVAGMIGMVTAVLTELLSRRPRRAGGLVRPAPV